MLARARAAGVTRLPHDRDRRRDLRGRRRPRRRRARRVRRGRHPSARRRARRTRRRSADRGARAGAQGRRDRRDRARLLPRSLAAAPSSGQRSSRSSRWRGPSGSPCSSIAGRRTRTCSTSAARRGSAAVGGILHCFSGDLEVARRGARPRAPDLDRGAGDLPERATARGGRARPPARSPRRRDGLPVPAAPAVAGSAQRAGVPPGHGRARGRAPGRAARDGRRRHDGERAPASSAPVRVPGRRRGSPGMTGPRAGLWRREIRRVLGGALNVTAARLMNLGRGGRPAPPALDLAAYRGLPAPTPLDTARLLAGRSNRERARLTEALLARGRPSGRPPPLPDRRGRGRQPVRGPRAGAPDAPPRRPPRRRPRQPGRQRQRGGAWAPRRARDPAGRRSAAPAAGAPGVLRRRGARHAGLARPRAAEPLSGTSWAC